jgi:hypothetical protein
MTQRQLWCSLLSPSGNARIAAEGIASLAQFPAHTLAQTSRTISIYQHVDWLYGYLEADDRDASARFASTFLAPYCVPIATSTGSTLAHPLLDVFHDGSPTDGTTWRVPGQTITHRIGSLARLVPETYSRYVFYHYQRQAEQPQSFNQRYIIGAHDRTLFSYQELPATTQSPRPTPTLPTQHTPADWQPVMQPHFEPWSDTSADEQLWRILPCLWSYFHDDARIHTME